MNNLKRVLSLALSGIMLVGMMAVGASAADFTDAENIEHDDAVNVLVALNVINGKDDGSFDPQGNVTRAEMAKMIAVAMNGGRDTNTGVKGTPTFTDIKGHWAESYIEYCYDMGIISGRGDGTFDPGANVTGLEATKMVLTALGYDSEAYKLTGTSWAVRTDELAKQADPKLYEELGTVVMANNASRDTAAQLIWNGLQNWTKRVTPQQNTSTGEVTFVYGNGTGTLLKERYDADIWVGTFEGNDKTGANLAEKGEITVNGRIDGAVDNQGNPAPAQDAHFPSDFDIANIGEEVKVIYKNGNGGNKNQPDKKDSIFGVFNTGAVTVYNIAKCDIKTDADTANGKVKFNGTSYDVADNGTISVNYGAGTGDSWTNDKAAGATKIQALNAKNGDTVKLVTDTNGKIAKVYVVTSDLAVVTSKNAEKLTLNSSYGTIKIADNDVYDDVKKDDVVVVTRLYDSDPDEGYTIVAKPEVLSGEITGFKDGKSVSLDGTSYKIYGETTLVTTGITDAKSTFNGGTNYIGDDFDLYMVNGHVRAAVQTSEAASNYSVVLEAKASSNTASVFNGLQLQVMDAEGVKTIITVSKDSPSGNSANANDGDGAVGITTADFPRGTIITYTMNKSNEAEVKIEKLYGTSTGGTVTAPSAASVGYNKDTKVFGGATTTTDCVLFVNTNSTNAIDAAADAQGVFPAIDMKAYKIRDLGTIAAASLKSISVLNADGKVVAAVLDLKGTPTGASGSRVYGIVSADNGTVRIDNVNYRQYVADVNGDKYTLNMKAGTLSTGAIVSFEPTNDSIYSNTEATSNWTSDKVHVIANGDALSASSAAVLGYAEELNETDGTLTIWKQLTAKQADGTTNATAPSNVASYVGTTGQGETFAVDNDTKYYFVDADDDKGVESGSVAQFDAVNGYSNIIVVYETVNGTKFAKSVIVETSNESNILALADATAPTVKVVAGATKGLTAPSTNNALVEDATANPGDNDRAFTGFVDGTTDTIKFTVDPIANADVTVTVNGNEYNSEDIDTGAAVNATGITYVVKVTVKELNKADKTFTYTVKVTTAV